MSKDLNSMGLGGSFDAACREDFPLFLRRVMATVAPGVQYHHNWHLEVMGEYLKACARGEITRLIINLPPRMLKSTVVSVAWPAWVLGNKPSERIMASSYAQALSLKHSTDCRAVMEAAWYRELFPEAKLKRGENEKEKFTTTQRGYRRAVSVGGAAIGEGGNILIIDDPLNPLQATHRTQREAVNEWFEHTWATRLDDKQRGAMVVVMQRLHKEDLSGYLLDKGGWEHLCLPAIAPARSLITCGGKEYAREVGEVLHVGREPMAVLERTKLELGSANFNAQYQQAPLKEEGAIVKPEWLARFDLMDIPPTKIVKDDFGSPARGELGACGAYGEYTATVQSWDTGIKAGAKHDASACATFVVRDGQHVLVDMLVVRMEYPELKRLMISHAARFSPEAILIEDKGNGQSLLQDLRRETMLPLIACQATADKVTRLVRVTPLMEAGKLALPLRASWLADFEQELLSFPDGAHDDQVDAVSQYLAWAKGRESPDSMRVRRL